MKPYDKESLASVDLGAFLQGSAEERQKIADQVDEICRSIGFLMIKNHGVEKSICHAAWASAELFFKQSEDDKLKARSENLSCPRGYFPVEGEALAKTRGREAAPPDRKETFSIGPLISPIGHENKDDFDFFYGSNIWPNRPKEFRASWTAYYRAMEQLGAQIMQLLAVALKLKDDYFVPYHSHHISALRAQHYPSSINEKLAGQLRAGAHSDYGSVTILNPDPIVGGLEVKSPSGNWITPPKVKDAFIVNIGDLLARWTNDRWVSTLHRVVDPENAELKAPPSRQSIAYFLNPNYDAKIKAIETCVEKDRTAHYAPVSAGAYLMDKFKVSI